MDSSELFAAVSRFSIAGRAAGLGLVAALLGSAVNAEPPPDALDDEAWRLKEMSQGTAKREPAGLSLQTGRSWKRFRDCAPAPCAAWRWLALRGDHRFHELFARDAEGQVHWAWVSRRSGRVHKWPLQPVVVAESWLGLAEWPVTHWKQIPIWHWPQGELRRAHLPRPAQSVAKGPFRLNAAMDLVTIERDSAGSAAEIAHFSIRLGKTGSWQLVRQMSLPIPTSTPNPPPLNTI